MIHVKFIYDDGLRLRQMSPEISYGQLLKLAVAASSLGKAKKQVLRKDPKQAGVSIGVVDDEGEELVCANAKDLQAAIQYHLSSRKSSLFKLRVHVAENSGWTGICDEFNATKHHVGSDSEENEETGEGEIEKEQCEATDNAAKQEKRAAKKVQKEAKKAKKEEKKQNKKMKAKTVDATKACDSKHRHEESDVAPSDQTPEEQTQGSFDVFEFSASSDEDKAESGKEAKAESKKAKKEAKKREKKERKSKKEEDKKAIKENDETGEGEIEKENVWSAQDTDKEAKAKEKREAKKVQKEAKKAKKEEKKQNKKMKAETVDATKACDSKHRHEESDVAPSDQTPEEQTQGSFDVFEFSASSDEDKAESGKEAQAESKKAEKEAKKREKKERKSKKEDKKAIKENDETGEGEIEKENVWSAQDTGKAVKVKQEKGEAKKACKETKRAKTEEKKQSKKVKQSKQASENMRKDSLELDDGWVEVSTTASAAYVVPTTVTITAC